MYINNFFCPMDDQIMADLCREFGKVERDDEQRIKGGKFTENYSAITTRRSLLELFSLLLMVNFALKLDELTLFVVLATLARGRSPVRTPRSVFFIQRCFLCI